jgi:hypothetical protein
VRKFRAFYVYGVLTGMARWQVPLQVSNVVMEATGI